VDTASFYVERLKKWWNSDLLLGHVNFRGWLVIPLKRNISAK
jgi:hypothetical protein